MCGGLFIAICKRNTAPAMPHIRAIQVERQEDSLMLDAASRRNLELVTNLTGGHENTLISVLDHTKTAMGSRLLKRWLNRPLRDHGVIMRAPRQCTAIANASCLFFFTKNITWQCGSGAHFIESGVENGASSRSHCFANNTGYCFLNYNNN